MSFLYSQIHKQENTHAPIIPTIILSTNKILHTKIKHNIRTDANTNRLEINISSILKNTTTQIISETIYHIKVAIEAPSIPKIGINV